MLIMVKKKSVYQTTPEDMDQIIKRMDTIKGLEFQAFTNKITEEEFQKENKRIREEIDIIESSGYNRLQELQAERVKKLRKEIHSITDKGRKPVTTPAMTRLMQEIEATIAKPAKKFRDEGIKKGEHELTSELREKLHKNGGYPQKRIDKASYQRGGKTYVQLYGGYIINLVEPPKIPRVDMVPKGRK